MKSRPFGHFNTSEMKKLYLAFLLNLLLVNTNSAQISWIFEPDDITVECNMADTDQDILDYIDLAEAEDANCGTVTINNDYVNPGSFNCDDEIDITFTVVDDCGVEPDLVKTITITISDGTDPVITTDAEDLMIDCNPAQNVTQINNWLNVFGNSIAEDNCADVANMTVTNDWDGTVPECSGTPDGIMAVEFTWEDECGNSSNTMANIIVTDVDPPIITSIPAPPPIECDGGNLDGDIEQALLDAIDAAVVQDFRDCTDVDDLVWTNSPIPGAPTVPTCAGGPAGRYEIIVTVTDRCGNFATETVEITIEDTTPPEVPGDLPDDLELECAGEIPPAFPLDLMDDCNNTVAVVEETVVAGGACPHQVTIERRWVFEDECGNSNGEHVQTIVVNDDEAPEWIGDTDDFLPEDISIVSSNCEGGGFVFPNGVFEDFEEEIQWTFPLSEGTHYEENCAAIFTASIPPTEPFPEGNTEVIYTVVDECGQLIEHVFTVNVVCGLCDNGGVACTESCETIPACHTCDVEDVNGDSCTPPFGGDVLDWPPDLCFGGVPHNISWFSFVAGAEALCVTISPDQCAIGSGVSGLQSGVYDFCEDDGGTCIGGDASCNDTTSPFDYEVNGLTIGNIYYIFVDGCNGAECTYEIEVAKGEPFVLDEPEEVVSMPDCAQSPLLPRGVFCPNTEIQFDIFHEGGEPYDPNLDADYYWEFSPPIDGLTNGSWNPTEDGFNIPPFTFEFVSIETEFEICMTRIETECETVSCGDCCRTITIAPLPDEDFGPYVVCVEDLIDGWDPSETGDDPNGDGLEWLGPNQIFLEQVEDAIDNNNGIISADVTDPDCDCPFTQNIQIIPTGNLDPTEVDLFMFDCQFRDEDGDITEYVWEWESGAEIDLFYEMDGDFVRVEGGSIFEDWDGETCDSLMEVTVTTAVIEGSLAQGDCTPTGTEYCFELLLDQLEDDFPDHPEVQPDYGSTEWINEQGVSIGDGQCFNVTPTTAGMYTVIIEYSFFDGAFGPPDLQLAECSQTFGPFMLDTGTAIPPNVEGDTRMCGNDLSGKQFNVVNPIPGSIYSWTFPAGTTGNVLNPPMNDMAEIDFTNYDFNLGDPILISADTPCGQSQPFELFVQLDQAPTPDFSLSSPICIGGSASAEFIGDVNDVSEFIWSTDNFLSGNQSGAGPIEYTSATGGTVDVSLIIVDQNGCRSEEVIKSFVVEEPLDVPSLGCTTTASSIEFTWDVVPGATGYEIAVLDAPSPQGPFTNTDAETSILFDNLSVQDAVEISVIALGPQPCGNSQASIIECQAENCPDPDWVFTFFENVAYCENAPIAAFQFDVSGMNGTVAYSSMVNGGIDVDGNVDPTAFPVGQHPIEMAYTYQNGDCTRSQSIILEVFAEPSVDFSVSSQEICLGEPITLDDTNVDVVATWDYGVDGSIDQNNEVTWTSTGSKTIMVNVETPATSGSCEASNMIVVEVLDTITMGPVTCSETGIDFVLFEWAAVQGATEFEVSIDGAVVGTQSDLMYRVDNLNPGDEVTISVTALNDNGICSNSTASTDCTAGDCPDGEFTFTPVGITCYDASIGAIQLQDPTITGAEPNGDGAWNSPFVDASGMFTPDATQDQTYMLVYEYRVGSCTYSDVLTFEMTITPVGELTVSDDDICLDETTTIEAGGTFDSDAVAVWDFGSGVNANGSGFGPYDLTFDAAGTYVISMTVDNDGCLSDEVTSTIEVDALIEQPNISCTSANDFVEFNWDDVTGVTEYIVYIDGVLQGSQSNSVFRVDNLQVGDEVDILIEFVTSGSSCTLADLPSNCITTDCPSATIDIDSNFPPSICLDGSEAPVQLVAELLNGPNEVGNETWSGQGITPDGLFDPSGLGGENVELTYTIDFFDTQNFSQCSYSQSVNINVFDAPVITSINPINPNCFEDNNNNSGGINPEVTGGTAPFTYTVGNLPSQDFPAFIDVLNPGSYDLLVTDDNGCTAQQTLEIFAAVEPALGIDGPLSILNTATGEYSFNTNAENIGDVIWLANGEIICQGLDCDPVSILGEDYPNGVDLVVQIFFDENCFIETEIRVDIFEIQRYYIPNVISETAVEGGNNSWRMFTTGGDILVRSVKIYDRWGELVHDQVLNIDNSTEIDLLWDGRWTEDGGEKVIPGVYVYMIDMVVGGREEIEVGDITVVR